MGDRIDTDKLRGLLERANAKPAREVDGFLAWAALRKEAVRQLPALLDEMERLRGVLEGYRSAFGQALEANGISFGEQQHEAERRARLALGREKRDG